MLGRRAFLVGSIAAGAAPVFGARAAAPREIAQGTFRDGDPVHRGSGRFSMVIGDVMPSPVALMMWDMNIVPGPNLLVYLVEDPDPLFPEDVTAGFLSLGKLKSLTGNQSYAIPAEEMVNIGQKWKSVVVWCDTFKTMFAVATIERT